MNSRLVPTPRTRLVDVNCEGTGTFGPRLISDAGFRTQFGLRVLSSTLPLAWVAAGRRAAYVSDGDLEGNVHYAAGIAICQSAGCIVSDLRGDPLHSGPGLIAAADEKTHHALLDMVSRL